MPTTPEINPITDPIMIDKIFGILFILNTLQMYILVKYVNLKFLLIINQLN